MIISGISMSSDDYYRFKRFIHLDLPKFSRDIDEDAYEFSIDCQMMLSLIS